MRKLLYVTMGFGFACGSYAYFLPGEYLQTAIYSALFLGIAVLPFSGRWKNMARMALLFFGCTAGFFWISQYDTCYLRPAAALDTKTLTASIRTLDYSYETAYGSAVDGMLTINDKPYQVKTYLNEASQIAPGDILTGSFRFRLTAPDAEEESRYHQGKGIFLIAYQRGDLICTKAKESFFDHIARVRLHIRTLLQHVFPEDTYPFALALLLGDGRELDYATDTAFKLSGIRHIVAVSGQHVAILFALIHAVTLRRRFLTALLGFPSLILFAALTGFTPSVTRACLMSGLMLLASILDREYDGATGLSFASLVMLACNPLVITSVSFQLSAGSVAGIYLFYPSIRKWLLSCFSVRKEHKIRSKLAGWLASSVAITLSAMTVSTPLCAAYFGTVSLSGVLTNLLTLWIISFVFYGILTVCILALLSQQGAALLAGLISVPIRYILLIAKTLGGFPLAAVYTRSIYIAAWLAFVYVLLLIFLCMRRKRPVVLFCCAVLGLCVSLLASWLEPMAGADLRFTVLDVGQGQCLLLQWKDQTYMVDCGGDSDTITADIAAETLLSQGITQLDALILTHLDRDHAGAAGNFLSRIDTKLLILPPEPSELPELTDGTAIFVSENLSFSGNGLRIEIFAPLFPGNSNEMSLCILFDTEKCDILITGDRNGFGERSLLRHNTIPDVDILVAGHHGSKNSTCEELLQQVKPEIVCISAGEDNSYGHPAPELLQRLWNHHCTVFRTDLQGDIIIRR